MRDFDQNALLDPQGLARFAGEIYTMRRARDGHLPKSLVGEAAWDMLLALFAEEPSKLTPSSLCYGSGVPQTTGMRWIEATIHMGLVQRSRHERDPSIVLLSLTADGRSIMEQSLHAMLRAARQSP